MNKKKRIFVISNPKSQTNQSSWSSLNKFISVVSKEFDSINVITSNGFVSDEKTNVYPLKYHKGKSIIINIFKKALFSIKSFFVCLKHITKNDKCYFWIADSMIFAFFAAKIKGAEINYFIYGNPLKLSNERKTFSRIKYMAKRSNYICAEGHGVFDEWSGVFDNKKAKIIHLYCETTNKLISYTKDFQYGCLTRLSNGKHIMEIIDAFSKFSRQHPECKLEIIGNGPLLDKAQQRIVELNSTKNISLLGWLDREQIKNHLCYWKFSLLVSDTEGLPNALLETMGYGIPNIITPVGAIKDVVNNNNSIILDCGSADSILVGLDESMKINEKQYLSMASNNFLLIKKQYSLENARANFIKTLEGEKQ